MVLDRCDDEVMTRMCVYVMMMIVMCMVVAGHILATCSADKTLRLLDLLEGRPIYTLHGHKGSVTSCTFSSNGDYFASGSQDKQVR